jgi:hypothetical protein
MPTDGRLISSVDLLYFLDHISLFYLGCEFPKSRCYFLGHWFCNLNIRKFNQLCYYQQWCIYREECEFSFVEDLIGRKHIWRKVLLSCSESVRPYCSYECFPD